ncbi:TRAP transporter small permease subunit [Salinihabitans flavidus]|nr:TRAP transporter small permease [Salinihabitans flavidus]
MGGANVIATAWILVIMVMILVDVIGRNAFLTPLAGVPEMVKYSIVGIVFLQVAHSHRHGELIRSDGLLGALTRRAPRTGAALDMLAQLAGVAVALMIAWSVWPKVIRAYERGEMEGISGHFQMPVWPFLAIVTAGSVLLAVSFLISAIYAAQRIAR